MKYHLHIVDSGSCASTAGGAAPGSDLATAAPLFFAHFALVCGHLHDVLELSASTASDHARAPVIADEVDNDVDADNQVATDPEDQLVVLQAAAAALQSCTADADEVPNTLASYQRQALEEALLPGADWGLVRPYPFFSMPFSKAETLARSGMARSASTGMPAPYMSFIVATDLPAYEHVVQYYQRLRLQTPVASPAKAAVAADHRPVAVVHVVSSSVARSCQAVQRVIESSLETQIAKVADEELDDTAENEEPASELDDGSDDISVNDAEWMEAIEEAVSLCSQVLGLDVLLSIV